MHSHPNARLTQKGRLRLMTQHLEHGRSLKKLATENGISMRCAYRWLARYRSGPLVVEMVGMERRYLAWQRGLRRPNKRPRKKSQRDASATDTMACSSDI